MDTQWTPVTAEGVSTAQALLGQLSASIAVANGLASSGRAMDLAGLDAAAGLVCAQILDLEPKEGLALRSAIDALNDNIHRLIQALQIHEP